MSALPIPIVRYPNRRFYARQESRYVSLPDIEALVRAGQNVEIRDSQTDEDLTRAVLTRIITEHRPDMMRLFPTDMLHFMLRSNQVMADFLRDYFQHSLTYLDYLQRHSAAALKFSQPMHWVKAWLDGIGPSRAIHGAGGEAAEVARLVARVAELEEELRLLRTAADHHRDGSATP